ncbi:hypothetical protein HG536_0C04900 [Torulaspora globosa]|uniref:Cyclin n=1 Tax=Torulaspora globosa TaxID=48254 RepID=A0A7G3ZFN5_9SACH|nr:uncharacterized protein HG536_0C04900 [Torulaspora globosa]QLL32321.1 hypothetical protein HG536_0C04900 [Torulaspora globosa]
MYSGSSSSIGGAASCGAINIPASKTGHNGVGSGDSGDESTPSTRTSFTPQSSRMLMNGSQTGSNRVITTEEDVCSSQSSSSPRRSVNNYPVPQASSMLSTMRREREYVDEVYNEHLIDSDDQSRVRSYDHSRTRSEPIVPIWERSKDCAPEQKEKVEPPDEELLNIAKFPTAKLLDMLTALLEKIVKSNDKLAETNPALSQERELMGSNNIYLNSVLSFRGKHIPQISLDHYFQRIQKYCPTTNDVFLSLLVYFDRISKRCNSNNNEINNDNELQYDIQEKNKQPQQQDEQRLQHQQAFVMDSHNIHRLLIAGVTVSTKFFSDFFYSNSRYARVGGISLQELNHLELQFLVLCDFELLISVSELQRYANLLCKFWHNSNMIDNPNTEPKT